MRPFLDQCLRALCTVPVPFTEHWLGLLGLGHGLLATTERRGAISWARRNATGPGRRARLALMLLYNQGRFRALGALHAYEGPDKVRERVIIHGLEHLEAERTPGSPGTIRLVFHLGPTIPTLTLGLHSGSVIGVGETDHLAWPRPRSDWRPLLDAHHRFVLLHSDGAATQALYGLRTRLIEGEVIVLAADAGTGAEAFRVRLGGGELVVRRIWWALRRQTGARVVPVLTHCKSSRLVAEVHPPLPPPDPDPDRDLELCRVTLTRILEDFVARFPEQCLALAIGAAE